MEKAKLEQLRTVFKTKVKGIITLLDSTDFFTKEEMKDFINETANELIYEVKIRIK